MAQRADLLAELDITLDGSGDYTGPWLDSAGVLLLRVVNTGSGVRIEESNDQTNLVQINTIEIAGEGLPYGQEEIPITARYFRVRGYGEANAALHAAVRVVA
jgi:type 1 fimbria pilin